jgi:hypothetical protein
VASLLGRVVSAAQGAWSGMQSGWSGSVNPIDADNPLTWDSYAARSARYNLNWGFYDNTIYGRLLGQVTAVKGIGSLYKWIRAIYNPVNRDVALYVAKIYGSNLDLETGTEGAIPLATVDDKLAQAVIQLWKTSNWNMNKNLFVRHGAIYGDNFIKLVDDEDKQQICMEVLHPGKVVEFARNYSNEIEYAVIEYVVPKSAVNAERYEYKEIITPDFVETYKDGKLYDYKTGVFSAKGKYKNDYGFVPMSQVQHTALGFQSGASCFHNTRDKIHELNDAASVLNDAARLAAGQNYVATGVNTTTDSIDMSRTSRDKISVIKLSSPDATFTQLTSNLDIAGALENIKAMISEIENDMPELSLHRMREGQMPSGVAVHMLWGDASDRLEEAAGNYDDATCRAQAMGIAMGALRRYKGYEGFAVTDYESGNLTHTIKNRSMFDETLDLQTQINTLAMVSSQPPPIQRLMLQKMDVDEATIDEIVNAAIEQDERDMQMAARSMSSTLYGEDDDEDNGKKPSRKELAEKQAKDIQAKNLKATNSGG